MAFPRTFVTDVTHAEPAPFGLLSPAATVVTSDDPHWTSGYEYESLDCSTTSRISSICSPTSGVEVVAGDTSGAKLWKAHTPFVIETSFSASTMSGDVDWEAKARERLEACQQKVIEREFWTGALAKQERAADANFPNRWLAHPDAIDITPTSGTAIKVRYGMALLEDALGTCGCGVRGTVHATRGTATSLGVGVVADGSTLASGLGTHVIAGAGYTGSGPNGVVPSGSQRWMYATGPVTVRLGPSSTRDPERRTSVDYKNNSAKAYAERVAGVTWDTCCHYAVLVDLALDYS